MPLFEVAVLKKKTETEPEGILSTRFVVADCPQSVRDKAICDLNVSADDIDDYEVLVRPFV